jgi:dihydroflavonol-4-reductase
VILVTGGAGFIGSHLVKALLEAGNEVRVLELPGATVTHLPCHKLDIIFGDIRDIDIVKSATKNCRHVYHLAADPNLWRKNPDEFDEINHQGTLNVVRQSLQNGSERVLHCSTESILAGTDNTEAMAVETLELSEQDMLGPYCLSKYRAERAVLELAREGAPVVVASPTLPVGPGDRLQTPPTRLSIAFCNGKIPAILDCRINLIDVRDVAKGLIATMTRGRPGQRYLIGNENLYLSQWLLMLSEETGQQAPRFRIPYLVALMYAWLNEKWSDYISGNMPLATTTGVRLARRNMHFDPSLSLSELDLKPRPIRQSAKDSVIWYRQQGWI